MVLTSVRQQCPWPLAPACGALGAGGSGRRAWGLRTGTRCWASHRAAAGGDPEGEYPRRQQVLCSHAEVEGGLAGGSGRSAPTPPPPTPASCFRTGPGLLRRLCAWAAWTCRSWARRSPPSASEDQGADQRGPACQPGVWAPAWHPCPATASPLCSALSLSTPRRL